MKHTLTAIMIVAAAAMTFRVGTAIGKPNPGLAVFKNSGCGACHTLAAAKAKGKVGPNLDKVRPTSAAVIRQVTRGGGGMPSFGTRLSKTQIKAVALFVSKNAGKK